MKKLSALLLAISTLAIGCDKQDDPHAPACRDTPPTNELCAAAFSRWFYNAQSDQCQLVNYSGCSQKGFATQQECETCVRKAR